MSNMIYNPSTDLDELRVMSDVLAMYVREEEVFWNIGRFMPQLTMGGFLMRLRRLQLFRDQLKPEQVLTLQDVEEIYELVHDGLNRHYVNKLITEATSRLNVMGYFLDDCIDREHGCMDTTDYNKEAFRRTVIQELLHALKCEKVNPGSMERLKNQIKENDAVLKAHVQPANFIWDELLQPAYPEDDYWWLYAQPSENASSNGSVSQEASQPLMSKATSFKISA